MHCFATEEEIAQAKQEWAEFSDEWARTIRSNDATGESLTIITERLLFCEFGEVGDDEKIGFLLDELLERIAAHRNTTSTTLAKLIWRFPDAFCRNPSATVVCSDSAFLSALHDYELQRLLRRYNVPRAIPLHAQKPQKISVLARIAQGVFTRLSGTGFTNGWISGTDDDTRPEKQAQDVLEDARLHVAICDIPSMEFVVEGLREKLRGWTNTARGAERHTYAEWVELGLAPEWVGGGKLAKPIPDVVALSQAPKPSPDQAVLLAEAEHFDTPSERLLEIARVGKNAVLLAVAQSPHSPTAALTEVMSDNAVMRRMHEGMWGGLVFGLPIAYAVAVHPNAEWEALENIIVSPHLVARRAARKHPYFAAHPDQREEMLAASRKNVLNKTWRGSSDYAFPVCVFLSRLHVEMPFEDWVRVTESDNWLDWLAAAFNHHLATAPTEIRDRFLNDGNQWVRTIARWRIAYPDARISF